MVGNGSSVKKKIGATVGNMVVDVENTGNRNIALE